MDLYTHLPAQRSRSSRLSALAAVVVLHGGLLFILLNQFHTFTVKAPTAIEVSLHTLEPIPIDRPIPLPPQVQAPQLVQIQQPEIKVEIELPPSPDKTNAITPPAPPPPLPPPKESAPTATDYVLQLAARLNAVKTYPLAARTLRKEGTVVLGFTLDSAGNLLDWRIVRSSAVQELDQEVTEMVKLAAPYPPFPKAITSVREEFVVPINFSLRRSG